MPYNGVIWQTIQQGNWKRTDIRRVEIRDEWQQLSSTLTHSFAHSFAHSEGFWGPCRAAREQPSVSCVCVGAGEGRPAPWKESSDPVAKGKRRGCSVERPRPEEERKEQPQNSFPPKRETHKHRERERGKEWGGGCWNNAPSAAGAMAIRRRVCECVRRHHFLFCVNWADLLSFLCCKFNSQLINMWPFGAPVCAESVCRHTERAPGKRHGRGVCRQRALTRFALVWSAAQWLTHLNTGFMRRMSYNWKCTEASPSH